MSPDMSLDMSKLKWQNVYPTHPNW